MKGFHTPNSDVKGFIRIWGVFGSAKFAYGGDNFAQNSFMKGRGIRLWRGSVVKFGCEGDRLPKPLQIRILWFSNPFRYEFGGFQTPSDTNLVVF